MRLGRLMPRPLMLAILAGALLLRLLVPQGWMPMRTTEGWRIAMCGGNGPATMPMPMPMQMPMPMAGMDHATAHDGTHKAPAPRHDPSEHPCAFAGVALPALATLSIALALPFLVVDRPRAPARMRSAIGRGLAAPPPPSTGPPLI